MMLRNALRLVTTNFSLVWKNLIFTAIALAIFLGLGVLICTPVIDVLNNSNYFNGISALISTSNSMSFSDIAIEIVNLINQFFNIIINNFSSLIAPMIAFVVLIYIYFGIIRAIRDLTTTEVLRGHMSSLSKFSYLGALIRKIGDGFLLGSIKFIFSLPFYALYIGIVMLGCYLISLEGNWLAVSPFIVFTLFVFFIALKITFFSCWTPALIMHKSSVFKAYKKGIKAVCSRFWITLSNAVVLVLMAVIINYAFSKFSFCVSLILTVPATLVLVSIFQMVVYYGSQGMRYYIDSQMIMTPKKFEEQDKPQKNKYLI